LATQWMSPEQRGFHLVLGAAMLAFLLARAGQTWGLDGWIGERRSTPESSSPRTRTYGVTPR